MIQREELAQKLTSASCPETLGWSKLLNYVLNHGPLSRAELRHIQTCRECLIRLAVMAEENNILEEFEKRLEADIARAEEQNEQSSSVAL